ncbi:polyamine ABC transporter substrate-binding protein [Pelobacter seleniigenes]|uniref:polyamine ABC transporter substrate-binding protein n=1 Tax=Pelobacter seleniigenes TaxID=407188 RepID=UPI0004A7847B|nr:polyamine ABC transporter substrate-binding protein [Pelobacter seleniigenes]
MKWVLVWGCLWFSCLATPALAEDRVVNVYNWSDYVAEDTIANFTAATGIKVVYDVYDANETLEAKLFAGRTGYDVVFPSAHPFAGRHIAAGLYATLDKSQLTNLKHLDPMVEKILQAMDPGNAHLVPYMWGTTGIGYNVAKVKALLGEQAPRNSWELLFNPQYAAKLADCGISLLDDEQEALGAALLYLGKDANSTSAEDIAAAAEVINKVRPYIRYFHSSQYINDLANGDICVAHGYSGDVLQARDRAEEAGQGVQVAYSIPREGAIMWIDVMAIPADAPHPEEAHAFINYLLEPQVIAGISNYVAYANPNKDATALLDEGIRNDPSIYPPEEVMARLVVPTAMPNKIQRLKTRTWTRIKTGY